VERHNSLKEAQLMTTDVASLSEQWFQAWLDKDAAVIERLAADDYLYVSPRGIAMDRAKIIAVVRSPGYRLDQGVRTEVVVRALGTDAALVRHRYQGTGSFDGRAFTDDQRCVMVWEKHDETWRLVMEQCSINDDASRV
jgi:ketosteroid isomerase-like protein